MMMKNLSFVFSVMIVSNLGVRAQGNSSTSNPCASSRKCGAFGVCNSEESQICSCLPGYYPRDSGNWSSGCLRRRPLKCEGSNGDEDGFLKLPMLPVMNLLGYSGRWMGQRNQCEGECLRNCSCLAYGYDGSIGCMFWRGTLYDVRKSTRSSSSSDLYVRVPHSELG